MANENNATAERKPKKHRIKETFSELKKVSWPTFGKVAKQTGAVFVVTIFFMLILMLMDWLLGLANRQLVQGLGGGTATGVLSNPELFAASVKGLFTSAASFPLLF